MLIRTYWSWSYGHKAKLVSSLPSSVIGTMSCLKFYYHMYGVTINRLNVFNGNSTVFTKSGQQGNAWLLAEVSIFVENTVSFLLSKQKLLELRVVVLWWSLIMDNLISKITNWYCRPTFLQSEVKFHQFLFNRWRIELLSVYVSFCCTSPWSFRRCKETKRGSLLLVFFFFLPGEDGLIHIYIVCSVLRTMLFILLELWTRHQNSLFHTHSVWDSKQFNNFLLILIYCCVILRYSEFCIKEIKDSGMGFRFCYVANWCR